MDDTAGAQAGTGPVGGPVILVVDNKSGYAGDLQAGARERRLPGGDGHFRWAGARFDDLRRQLVLLDDALPGRDALARARAIRARPSAAAVPILIFTALPRETRRPRARSRARRYSPIVVTEVLAIWQAWCGPEGHLAHRSTPC